MTAKPAPSGSDERVSVTIRDHVADVRLVRADKMNALDHAMFDRLIEVGQQLGKDDSVRAVVLSGEGRAFCAGLDMGNFGKMAEGGGQSSVGRLGPRTHGIANRAQYTAWVWRELRVPVIAAIHGVAFGGGFQIALGADMRYAAPATRFSIMEIKWGLIPDMGGTPIMRHLAREDIVRELTYTGRIFSVEEAQQYGFVTRIVENPHEHALQIAGEIASKSPTAIRSAKQLLNVSVAGTAAEGLMAESELQEALIGSPNQVEAVMSNLQKRAPVYKD